MPSILPFCAGHLHIIVAILVARCNGGFGLSVQSDPECLYLEQLSAKIDGPINSASLPSVSASCISSWNNILLSGSKNSSILSLCISDCQSLHDLFTRCKGQPEADFYFGLLCGEYNGVYCTTLYGSNQFASLFNATEGYCGNQPTCSSNCKQAAQSLLNYAGCCSVLFSNQTYAACSLPLLDYCQPMYISPNALGLKVSDGPIVTAATAIVTFAALCGLILSM